MKTKLKTEKASAAKSKAYTFGEYARKYVELYKLDRSVKTREMYENLLENHIDAISDVELGKVTRDDVQNTINICKSHPRTCQQLLSLITQVYENAIANGLQSTSPCIQITLPRYVKRTKRALTDIETKAIVQAHLQPLEKAMILTLYGSGMRPGELFALEWNDVDFRNKELSVTKALQFKSGHPYHVGYPKTNTSLRTIPVPDWCIEALEIYRTWSKGDRSAAIFNDEYGRYRTYAAYRNIFDRAIRHAFSEYRANHRLRGIESSSLDPESITPYIFRHNYCTLCRKHGVSIETCQRLMGHSTARMVLDVYSHIDSKTEMYDFAKGFKLEKK